jgi:membrane-associated phospholipid phosphatase
MGFEEVFLFFWGLVRYPVREASVLFNEPLLVMAFSIALVLAASWHYKEQKQLPFLACALILAFLLGLFFKPFLGEIRPCVYVPGKIPCPLDNSLPSLHALLAFTLAIVSLGNRSFPIYLLYSLFIAFSRVYLGVHTISEVAAGLSLAFFACVLAELSFRTMKWHVPNAIHIKHDIGRIPHTKAKIELGDTA